MTADIDLPAIIPDRGRTSSTAHLNATHAPSMFGVHASPNHVAITVVVVRIVVGVRLAVTVVIAIRSVEAVTYPRTAERQSAPEAATTKSTTAQSTAVETTAVETTTMETTTMETTTMETAPSESASMKTASSEAAAMAASAKAAAPVSATAAACLCTRRKQRPGNQGGCQYHHRSSSSHEIFLSTGRAISDHRTSRPGLIWSPCPEWLTGNFEGSNRSSRCTGIDAFCADQKRRTAERIMLHRTRDLLIRQRTQLINALRAHLAELGLVAAKGREGVWNHCSLSCSWLLLNVLKKDQAAAVICAAWRFRGKWNR
jgi:hypothetical protein